MWGKVSASTDQVRLNKDGTNSQCVNENNRYCGLATRAQVGDTTALGTSPFAVLYLVARSFELFFVTFLIFKVPPFSSTSVYYAVVSSDSCQRRNRFLNKVLREEVIFAENGVAAWKDTVAKDVVSSRSSSRTNNSHLPGRLGRDCGLSSGRIGGCSGRQIQLGGLC